MVPVYIEIKKCTNCVVYETDINVLFLERNFA